jgi:hypothetical protein
MHFQPKNSSYRWSAVADLHTNTCNKTNIQQNTKRENYTVTLTGSRTDFIAKTREDLDTAIGPVSDDR